MDIKGDLSIKGLGGGLQVLAPILMYKWVWVSDCQGQAPRIDEEDGRND